MSVNQQVGYQFITSSGTRVSLKPQAVNQGCASKREREFHLDFFQIVDVNVNEYTVGEMEDERDLPNLLDVTENDLYEHLGP